MSILSGFSALTQDAIYIAKRGASQIGALPVLAANGLHEIITGVVAPGGGRQAIFPHDHTRLAGHGGAVLARNNTYVFDQYDAGWKITPTVGGIWTVDDASDGGAKDSDTDSYPPDFVLYASPGVEVLDARILVEPILGTAGSAELRVANSTTGSSSSAVVIPTTGQQWLAVADIPVRGDALNHLTIQVKVVPWVSGDYVTIHSAVLSETRPISESLNGTYDYNSAPKP